MTNKKKKLIIFSIIAVLLIVCAGAYWLTFRYDDHVGIRAVMLQQQKVTAQMKNGSCQEVELAINGYLKLLDKYKKGKSIVSNSITAVQNTQKSHIAPLKIRLWDR